MRPLAAVPAAGETNDMARRAKVMLIVETSLAYGRGVLRGINKYLVAHGPWSIYLELRELQVEPPEWLDAWSGDGIISRSTTPELAERLLRRHLPTVDLTDIYGDLGLPYIWTDHAAVGRQAAAHLLERGFKHFGYCGFAEHAWSGQRLAGFRGALPGDAAPCAVYESPWGTSLDHTWEQQQQEIAAWIRELPKPLGIMAANDLRGQHVLEACRREELSVPEEVAVVGVDNDELLCELCEPPLSSVAPNTERIGFEAAALLERLIAGKPPANRGVLVEPLGVVTRQSSDILAIDDPLVASAVQFIRENACQGIGVDDVLRQVPLSRSVLEKRFRKYLSRSPQVEIRLVQLKRVRQLLAETDLSLEQIARLTGFRHSEYMSVVFKRETGETPGQFRRKVQPQPS